MGCQNDDATDTYHIPLHSVHCQFKDGCMSSGVTCPYDTGYRPPHLVFSDSPITGTNPPGGQGDRMKGDAMKSLTLNYTVFTVVLVVYGAQV
jgi:hypothetical protein